MKISTLFTSYNDHLSSSLNAKKIFAEAGMTTDSEKLQFGFFPLGSGIFKTGKSRIDVAEITNCKIMVLGNDFGTIQYISKHCKENSEKLTNPTIRNLLNGLELDVESTFFTNLFLGLRINGTNIKRVQPIRKDYEEFCFAFFKRQLDFLDPKVVLCLGKDVGKTLSAFSDFSAFKRSISKLFEDETKKEYIVNTQDEFFGQRRFVLIPHPSFAHINWNRDDIKNKINRALVI